MFPILLAKKTAKDLSLAQPKLTKGLKEATKRVFWQTIALNYTLTHAHMSFEIIHNMFFTLVLVVMSFCGLSEAIAGWNLLTGAFIL